MRCNAGACRKPDAINIQSGLLVVSGDIRSFNPRGQFFPLQLLWRNTSLGQRVCMHDTGKRRKNERAENCRITDSHNPFPFSICPRHKAPRRSAKIEPTVLRLAIRVPQIIANVRSGSEADMATTNTDVRSTPKSRHRSPRARCSLSANGGHSANRLEFRACSVTPGDWRRTEMHPCENF
jgi:hypothetical protein